MTISLKTLPPENTRSFLDTAISSVELQTMETKRVSGKMVGKALETICAFANTSGGLLFLGVEDADKARGKNRF